MVELLLGWRLRRRLAERAPIHVSGAALPFPEHERVVVLTAARRADEVRRPEQARADISAGKAQVRSADGGELLRSGSTADSAPMRHATSRKKRNPDAGPLRNGCVGASWTAALVKWIRAIRRPLDVSFLRYSASRLKRAHAVTSGCCAV